MLPAIVSARSARRLRVLGALAIGAAALAIGHPADARSRSSVSGPEQSASVIVDVSRLRALGLGPTADLVQRTIAASLRERPPVGTRLVVRIDALSIGSYAGTDSGGGGGGAGGSGGGGGGVGNDSMEGVGLLVGPGGEVRASYPIVLTLPSDSGGAYYLPGNEQRRVVVLAENFVRWIERKLG